MRIAAIAVVLGLAGYSLVLRYQAVAVERECNSLRALLLDQHQRKQRLEALVIQARAIQSQQSSEMKELKRVHSHLIDSKTQLIAGWNWLLIGVFKFGTHWSRLPMPTVAGLRAAKFS